MQIGIRPETQQSLLNKITTLLYANITAIPSLWPQINSTEFQFGEETPMQNESQATLELAEASALPTFFVALRAALFYVTLAVTMGAALLLIHSALYLVFRQRYLDKLARVSKALYDLKDLPPVALKWAKSCFLVMAQFVESISNFFTQLSESFKSLVVNNISTKTFLTVAKILPIGDWLKYEELDYLGENSLYRAIKIKNTREVEAILDIVSKPVLYKLLKDSSVVFGSAIECAAFEYKYDIKILQKILQAIQPEDMINVLNTVWMDIPFALSLAQSAIEIIDVVMNAIISTERYRYICTKDSADTTPLMSMLMKRHCLLQVKALLKHCSSQETYSLLKMINVYGDTPLTIVAQTGDAEELEYLLSFVPQPLQQEFFLFHNQGLKALQFTFLNEQQEMKKLLESYGLTLPPNLENLTREEIKNIDQKWQANEKFKKKVGEYPHLILGISNFETDNIKIRKAYIISTTRTHPDKTFAANREFDKVKLAYDFYTNPEEYKSYLKP